jgi:pimeloyl-ACP methyl ester carboxylesterase
MPAVFVHGNSETTAVWEPLPAKLAAVRSDLICLSPPGFGATQADYRDWLVEELTALGEPVDLVGHDWGGGHVVNVEEL